MNNDYHRYHVWDYMEELKGIGWCCLCCRCCYVPKQNNIICCYFSTEPLQCGIQMVYIICISFQSQHEYIRVQLNDKINHVKLRSMTLHTQHIHSVSAIKAHYSFWIATSYESSGWFVVASEVNEARVKSDSVVLYT